ncbi:hypothetical protein ACFVH0_15110 [Streptomyces sp. NPDC127117]|uniref:hypothetical protein n=1 Tax=Streptomyces sp. NPDC127117 TaxID=3345368 RepID=UPI003637894C
MGLEGAVQLAHRKELAAIMDPGERERVFRERVAELYEHGKAVNAAAALEIDAVIDPADSRAWILSAPDGWAPDNAPGGRRPFADTWCEDRSAAPDIRPFDRPERTEPLHGTARSGGPIS